MIAWTCPYCSAWVGPPMELRHIDGSPVIPGSSETFYICFNCSGASVADHRVLRKMHQLTPMFPHVMDLVAAIQRHLDRLRHQQRLKQRHLNN